MLNANMVDFFPTRTNATGFGATAALLQRSFYIEIDGDSLSIEQRKPIQAPRQEFLREKKR